MASVIDEAVRFGCDAAPRMEVLDSWAGFPPFGLSRSIRSVFYIDG